eukprot:2393250-Ditylum_brightwellii.AAC.1
MERELISLDKLPGSSPQESVTYKDPVWVGYTNWQFQLQHLVGVFTSWSIFSAAIMHVSSSTRSTAKDIDEAFINILNVLAYYKLVFGNKCNKIMLNSKTCKVLIKHKQQTTLTYTMQ